MNSTATKEAADLCANYLRDEEAMLSAALPMVRAVQAFVAQGTPDMTLEITRNYQELAALIDNMVYRRQVLRAEIARRLNQEVATVRLSQFLERLPFDVRNSLQTQLARVRNMAHELVAANHRLSNFVRIFLDAYQCILQDVTRTKSGSGRYGPQGKAESPVYRPLLQIHG